MEYQNYNSVNADKVFWFLLATKLGHMRKKEKHQKGLYHEVRHVMPRLGNWGATRFCQRGPYFRISPSSDKSRQHYSPDTRTANVCGLFQSWLRSSRHQTLCRLPRSFLLQPTMSERKLACPQENWPVHKKTCSSSKKESNNDPVPCVMLGAQAGGPSVYRKTTIPSNDDIFHQAPTPISQRFGFPLILRRSKPVSQYSTRSANDDNPHATCLMIDPGHEFAPPEWQSGVGDILVVRADRKPLDIAQLAVVTDYVSDILDAFGDGMEGAEVARKYYRKERLVVASNGQINM